MPTITIDTKNMNMTGENILTKQDGNFLIVAIDMTEILGQSKSGLSNTIASSGGHTPVGKSPRGKTMKLNLYLGEPA
jgi:hypothetical protein